jgi:hypothetical protein
MCGQYVCSVGIHKSYFINYGENHISCKLCSMPVADLVHYESAASRVRFGNVADLT